MDESKQVTTVQPSKKAPRRTPLGYQMPVKALLVALACLMLLATVAGAALAIVGGETGLYTESCTDFKHELYFYAAHKALYEDYYLYEALSWENVTAANATEQIARVLERETPTDLYLRVTDPEGRVLYDNIPDLTPDWEYTTAYSMWYSTPQTIELEDGEQITLGENVMEELAPSDGEPDITVVYEVTLLVPREMTAGSTFSRIAHIAVRLHDLRWALIVVTLLCLALSVALIALLMMVAGRYPGEDTPRCRGVDRIPYDVFLGLYALLTGFEIALVIEMTYTDFVAGLIALITGLALVDLPLIVLLFMSTATRCKCGTIFRNTLIFYVLRLLRWCLVGVWRRLLCPVGRGICAVVRGIPLIWKGTLTLAALTAIELVWMLFSVRNVVAIYLWMLYKLITLPLLLYVLVCMRRLQQGAQRMAQGDLSHRVNERGLPSALREHATDLNSISIGMNRAVEERMKSERLRTELITNVSHDIKTPLTSIINYVDLLGKEPPANERAAEYLDVLQRQSQRLKKLIEDLMEASRASTGNISVNAAPLEVGILLSQAMGEYQERLRVAGLETVYHAPENTPVILADGQLLWRVFDNLLSNAVKYAMRGSRLYIDLCEAEEHVCVIFRNVSAQPLHVAPEELTERFVRGDEARHGEGSGLGLSIAKSLVELQGGTLDICVDGDLFKVTVSLKTMQ